MPLNLYMVGLTVKDMSKSLDFYRHLGLTLPEADDTSPHIEVKMSGDFTFFLDSKPVPRDTQIPTDSRENYPILLEFYLPTRDEVTTKYNELISLGHTSYRAPFETSFGMWFALIDDPDGHTVLLSAS